MSSFKSNVARGAAAPIGTDLTLTDLLMVGLVDWEGANQEEDRPKDSMRFAATVSTQANSLQLQASGLDTMLNHRSEDHRLLLGKNADLDREVGELKEVVTRLEGELGVLLARMEALEWAPSSEYLSVEDLLRLGGDGGVVSMDSGEVAALGLRPDFQDLVDRPDPVDTTAPLFPHSF
ncbi:hypothetical protein BDM02DRAFT_3194510 [Thelephora ganbajun]|uniref:Uncharacterized protein n=1 Tax=Thelephora ganbajun TaxID=370292 RepID=A0ACB6YW13_THEGA|nr:hypothetical protein BDM02DRAFT_3194510 [Thelephora ganbajun]